jgi:hypothetical protein
MPQSLRNNIVYGEASMISMVHSKDHSERLRTFNAWLMRTSAFLLFTTAVLKILSAFSKVAYLGLPDPVIYVLSNRSLLLVAAEIELGLAALLALRPHAWYSRHGLLALCAGFVGYRGALHFFGGSPPCPCLGRASDWLHITPEHADRLAIGLLVIFAVAAGVSVLLHASGRIESSASLIGTEKSRLPAGIEWL